MKIIFSVRYNSYTKESIFILYPKQISSNNPHKPQKGRIDYAIRISGNGDAGGDGKE